MPSQTNFRIPVLAYHRVIRTSGNRNHHVYSPYALPQSQFSKQMQYLVENGFRAVTLGELLANPDSAEKRVIISFDDGYLDNYTSAFPILKEMGLKATFFVIVNRIGSKHFMSWHHLRKMLESNMEIQSHTLSHKSLSSLKREDLLNEVLNSKITLENELGSKVRFISFPHGMYNKKVLQACKMASYVGCCNSDFGYFNPGQYSYLINRFMVKQSYDFNTFTNMVNADWRFVMKFGSLIRAKRTINQFIGFGIYHRLYRMVYRTRETIS